MTKGDGTEPQHRNPSRVKAGYDQGGWYSTPTQHPSRAKENSRRGRRRRITLIIGHFPNNTRDPFLKSKVTKRRLSFLLGKADNHNARKSFNIVLRRVYVNCQHGACMMCHAGWPRDDFLVTIPTRYNSLRIMETWIDTISCAFRSLDIISISLTLASWLRRCMKFSNGITQPLLLSFSIDSCTINSLLSHDVSQ